MGWLERRREARTPQAQAAERRDPTAATTQLRWTGPGQAQINDWDAATAIRFGYHANVVAYRAVAVIAETISGLNFRAGTTPPESPAAPAPHNLDARLARLLGQKGRPNPQWSATKLWRWTTQQRLVAGCNAWEIEEDGNGAPLAFWAMPSSSLKAIPSKGGTEYFTGFEFGRADDPKRLQPHQVHYGWTPSLKDVRQPDSALNAARYALSIALGIDQHQYAFIRNGAVPATIVGVQAFASTEAFEAFKDQWHDTYRGPANSGKTHIVPLDAEDGQDLSKALFIQTVGQSAKDARLPESYKEALVQVAMALGVPWSKLDASGRTFDNASEEDRTYWWSTILPLCTDLADEVNVKLAPRLGPEVGWFDLSGVRALQPVPVAAPSEIPGLIQAGVISAEEARPWLFLSGPAPEPPAPEPVVEPPAELEPAEEPPALPPAPADRHPAGREERATVDQEARRSAIWRATDAAISRQEGMFERRFRRLFNRQRASVLDRLEATSRQKPLEAAARARAWTDEQRGPADSLFDPAFWTVETEDEARSLFESLASDAFTRIDSHFGVSFNLEAEFAQTFINTRANQLAGQVTQTTYRAITEAMAEGVGAGEGIPDLARRIREVFDEASTNRAAVIARTEVISGHNAAALAAATSLPADVVAGQQWIATRDSRTRPSHAEADGQIVAVGQPFQVGASAAAYPGDPQLPAEETIQCRCTVAFLTPDEFEAEAATYAQALTETPVPVARARVALALVAPGEFDERRFRRALEAAA